jgi:hypothetical protein
MASNNSSKSTPVHVHPEFVNHCKEHTRNILVYNQVCHIYKHNNIHVLTQQRFSIFTGIKVSTILESTENNYNFIY